MFGGRPGNASNNEDIRGLLNAGHRRGAVAGRCVAQGNTVTTEELPAYAAVALAGIGDLPDTIFSRAIIVRMNRRAPGERVEPFRARLHTKQGTCHTGSTRRLGEGIASHRLAYTAGRDHGSCGRLLGAVDRGCRPSGRSMARHSA